MQGSIRYADPSDVRFEFPCIKVKQPIGDLYVGALPFRILCAIADFDVRRVMQEERDVERYLGIQRPLHPRRVKEIGEFVNFADASFPTSIIIAVDARAAKFDEASSTMTLENSRDENDPLLVRQIARVIDGQHRIAGLYQCKQEDFDCPVTILVDMDIADQAQMFARVNLSQTKVNPSLVYDLFELAQTRSPQKTAHEITVRLDRDRDGPFFKRIKRLGVATPGRSTEMLTQATVVRGVLQHITDAPDSDRDIFLRGRVPPSPNTRESQRLVFRQAFIEGNDDLIFEAITSLFEAVSERWPAAWSSQGQGYVLARTNGYLALMRYLRDSTLYWAGPNTVIPKEKHLRLLEKVPLKDEDLTTENFGAGTSGEAALYRQLIDPIPR